MGGGLKGAVNRVGPIAGCASGKAADTLATPPAGIVGLTRLPCTLQSPNTQEKCCGTAAPSALHDHSTPKHHTHQPAQNTRAELHQFVQNTHRNNGKQGHLGEILPPSWWSAAVSRRPTATSGPAAILCPAITVPSQDASSRPPCPEAPHTVPAHPAQPD